jgi:glyoxylase I family protein
VTRPATVAGMDIAAVHHVSLNVTDVETTKDFYVDVLGFTVEPRPDFDFPGYWLGVADGRQVHLIGDAAVPENHGQHFALHVADLDAVVEELRSKGIDVSDPKAQSTGARQAFAVDPSGNMVEFHQPVG